MNSLETINVLKKLQPVVKKKFKAKIIGIFGSTARNENTYMSDIDVLVEFESGASLFDLSALKNFLEETFKCHVDVVTKSALRKEITQSIINDLIFV
jgi:uncharacterized protein